MEEPDLNPAGLILPGQEEAHPTTSWGVRAGGSAGSQPGPLA